MSGQILQFPAPTSRQRQAAVEGPHPYEFWVEILDGLSPPGRQRTILRALHCHVIDDEDAKILSEMWPDRKGG